MPTHGSRLLTAEVKKAPTEGSASNQSSPNSNKDTPKSRGLANLANRAQRNMDLPVIEENVAGNEEEETLRTNKGLYRPPQRSALSRDSSV